MAQSRLKAGLQNPRRGLKPELRTTNYELRTKNEAPRTEWLPFGAGWSTSEKG